MIAELMQLLAECLDGVGNCKWQFSFLLLLLYSLDLDFRGSSLTESS